MVELMEHQTEEGEEMVDEMAEEVEEVVSNKTRDKIPLVKDNPTLYHQDVRNSGRRSHQSSKPVVFTLTLQADKDAVTAGLWVMVIANVVTKGKTLKMSGTSTSIHNEGGYLPKRHPIRSI